MHVAIARVSAARPIGDNTNINGQHDVLVSAPACSQADAGQRKCACLACLHLLALAIASVCKCQRLQMPGR